LNPRRTELSGTEFLCIVPSKKTVIITSTLCYFNSFLGIGGYVHVFEIPCGKFITKEEIFEGQSVHNVSADKTQNLAIIGGKMVRTFKLES
jgi:hypothetical protein